MNDLTPMQFAILCFAIGYLLGLVAGIINERRRKS